MTDAQAMLVYTLIREQFKPDGILGRLFNDDMDQLACTMEHSYNNLPKLPVGTYRCQRGMHSLHSRPQPFETFEVMDVPNHTGILFHPGNWQGDSNGCILLGRVMTTSEQGAMLTNSRDTFHRFMLDLEGVEQFTLIVKAAETGNAWV